MPTSMTSIPVERIPSISDRHKSGELGRMSRPTIIVFSFFTFSPGATLSRLR